jgi:hypothetical protein
MTTPGPAPAAPAAPPSPPPKPKMKRWKKALLVTGSVLTSLIVIILVAGPAIIGSIAQSRIPAIVQEKLQATATVGNVSFSWSGRLQIDDLRLVPKTFSEPLVEVKKVDVKIDLGSAIGGKYVADVDVAAPKILLEKGADGKFNYEFPPQSPKPADPKAKEGSGKNPFVQASLKVHDGEVRIRGKGRETLYQNLTLNVKVDTLEKPVDYDLSLASAFKDTLKIKGGIDLNSISGPATVTLERLSLRNLTGAARAYSDVLELDGIVSGSLHYEIKDARRVAGSTKIEVLDFSALLPAEQKVKFDRLTLTHDGAIDEKGSGRHVVVIGSGKALSATITTDVTDAFNTRIAKTEVKVDSDLAALAELLRGSGKLPKGMALAGAITLRGTCNSKGPSQADLDANKLRVAADADLTLTGSNLDITKDGTLMKLDGFQIHHRGTLDENGTGENSIVLESGKALQAVTSVHVTDALGKTPGVKADWRADSDLGELGKMLEKLIGLRPDMALEGAAHLIGKVEARGADSVHADLSLGISNLMAVDLKDKKRHEIDKGIEVKLVGGWDGKSQTATAEVLKLTSSFATMDGKGGAAFGGDTPEIRETLITLDADLEKLAGKLKSFMENPPALAGKATLRASAAGEKISVNADLKGIKYEKYGPFDANLEHKGSLDVDGTGTQLIFLKSGKAVDLNMLILVTNAYKDSRSFQIGLQTDSDLAALSAMMPGLVDLKSGTTLSGKVEVNGKAQIKGSTRAKFELTVNVDSLDAVEKGKHQEIDKSIRLQAWGLWDGQKQAVSIDTFTFTSAFATVDAKGGVSLEEPMTVRESSLQLKADLEKLGAKLGLFMADAPGLAGSVSANASYAGEKYTLDAAAKGVKIVSKGKTTGPIDAIVAQKGTFSTAKDGAFRIETGAVTSSAADLRVSGEVRKVLEEGREGEIKIEAVARPLEISKWVPDLDLGGPEIKLTAAVTLKLNLITVKGQTKIDGLTRTGKDDKGAVVTKTARTGAVDFTVTMKDPDLLATLKTPTFEWLDKGYAAKGGLEAQVTYNDRGSTGTTKLTNLEISDDQKNVVKDPGLTLVHDIGLADGNKAIDLRKVEISSTFLKGTISGRVLRLDPALEIQKLRLAFRYIPDRLGAVAQPWLPGRLEGAEEKTLDVTLDGKAASTDVLAILRGTRGGIDVDLAKFTMQGVTVAGKTHLDLKDGKMASDTPLSVNKGKTDLVASLDFNPPERKPQSSLTFHAKDVDANGQMGPLLEKLNPIFHTSGVDAKVDGQIQSDFRLVWAGPLDPAQKDWIGAASKSLGGTGLFGAQNLNIEGSPAVVLIMAALGQGNALEGELVATQIRIANGRCEYENMTLRGSRKDAAASRRDQEHLAAERQQLEADKPHLNPKEVQKRQEELRMKEEDLPFRYVLRFSGWVGFDKKMELRVLMPMSDGLAKAHPSLTKYIGSSFWVDLKGTTDHPSLDTKKMLAEAVKRAAEGILMDKLDDALKGLFDKKKKDEK